MKKKSLPADRQGYTLVELIVAVAVFSLVVVAVVGLFTNVLRSQRKSIAIQNVQDNGRYLIGFMAKEIRMSEIATLDGESLILDIIHPVHGNIQYSFSGGQLTREDNDGMSVINSDEVQADGKFIIDGKTVADREQPKVTIILKTETTGLKTEERAKIELQTTLSQRKLD